MLTASDQLSDPFPSNGCWGARCVTYLLPRRGCPLIALRSVIILSLPADAVRGRALLCADSHVVVVVHVPQSVMHDTCVRTRMQVEVAVTVTTAASSSSVVVVMVVVEAVLLVVHDVHRVSAGGCWRMLCENTPFWPGTHSFSPR